MAKPIVIAIEGIIGGGKTTLINLLKNKLTFFGWRVTVVKEPVDKWESSGILKLFYADPARWGYHFQTKAFHDRITENREAYNKYASTTDVFILERSPFTDNIFMSLLHDDGSVSDMEYQHYQEWWSLWHTVMPYTIDLFIYLRPDLDVCMQRTRERNRNGESGVSREYQRKLLEKHDEFFNPAETTARPSAKDLNIPCVLLSTNDNFKDITVIQDRIVNDFDMILKRISRSNPSVIVET